MYYVALGNGGCIVDHQCLVVLRLENLVNGVVIDPIVPFDWLVPSELKNNLSLKILLVWENKIYL